MARSISDCTTLVNDAHESRFSRSGPVQRQTSSANNPSNIRSSFSLPSHNLLNLQHVAEDERTKDKKNSEPMKRFLSEKDRASNSCKTTSKSNIQGHGMQPADADEHPPDETASSSASPLCLYQDSPLMRHLDNGTWQVGLRSPNVPGKDVR